MYYLETSAASTCASTTPNSRARYAATCAACCSVTGRPTRGPFCVSIRTFVPVNIFAFVLVKHGFGGFLRQCLYFCTSQRLCFCTSKATKLSTCSKDGLRQLFCCAIRRLSLAGHRPRLFSGGLPSGDAAGGDVQRVVGATRSACSSALEVRQQLHLDWVMLC